MKLVGRTVWFYPADGSGLRSGRVSHVYGHPLNPTRLTVYLTDGSKMGINPASCFPKNQPVGVLWLKKLYTWKDFLDKLAQQKDPTHAQPPVSPQRRAEMQRFRTRRARYSPTGEVS